MRRYLLLGLMLVWAAGCAGPSEVVRVEPGDEAVEIKASSFDFEPDVIRTSPQRTLVLVIENVAGMEHNFTLKDPSGAMLVARDLPADETVRVEVSLSGAGEYPFYCDKPLHPTFGMKGRIVVEE